MRKGFNLFCGIITNELGRQVTHGDAFIFINKPRTHLKMLVYEQGAFTIFYRRLENGAFEVPAFDLDAVASLIPIFRQTSFKRGKINLYYYETATPMPRTSPSGGTQYEYHQHFVFQKGDGPLQELSKEAISEMMSDNREAQAKFNAQFHPGQKFLPKQLGKHPKVLFEVIDMYNNG